MKLLTAFMIGNMLTGNFIIGQVKQLNEKEPGITGYYTRLPYDDQNFTGKYADVVVTLKSKGSFIFSREYGYQPYWQPNGGKRTLVNTIIERKGDGPAERPDNHNISSNVAIVQKTPSSVKVHWRYAPNTSNLSFTDFRMAYNEAGNPSSFYAAYTDEYFTIYASGTVLREVRNGTYTLADWENPSHTISEKILLTPDGLTSTTFTLPSIPEIKHITGKKIKSFPLKDALLYLPMDEGLKSSAPQTVEMIANTKLAITGVHPYWRKGVSGACLSFDSYSNAIVIPAGKVPAIGTTFSIEAWVAPQEYPFNDAAIIDHLHLKQGYFAGISAKGEVVVKLGDGDSIQRITASAIPLYQWSHIAIRYSPATGLAIFINGIQDHIIKNTIQFKEASNTDLSIGMTTHIKQAPLGSERDITRSFTTRFVFSGLLDEIKLYGRVLNDKEIIAAYEALKPANNQPLQTWVLPVSAKSNVGFGAEYTTLKYAAEWDGLWRVGQYADLVVNFDKTPWHYVFWRGTRYLPSLVTGSTEKAIWSSDQSPEHYSGQCYEHMSDMQCRFSNIRLIYNSPARVLVHWRNSSANIGYQWPGVNKNDWGIWTDEYWSIYPDGIAVRHQVLHNGPGVKIIEMNQNEILLQPGQSPESVLMDSAVTVGNIAGELQTFCRSSQAGINNNQKINTKTNLQYINLKSDTKQFEIGEPGTTIDVEIFKNMYWNGWNHYPVQLIPSDGTTAFQYDRPASICPATFREVRHTIDSATVEAMTLYGLTNRKPESLNGLNRFWNFAPALTTLQGGYSEGFSKQDRAYQLIKKEGGLKFSIAATEQQPLFNPVFIISNWNSANPTIKVTLNSKMLTEKKDYQLGLETDTNGNTQMVVWVQLETKQSVTIEIK